MIKKRGRQGKEGGKGRMQGIKNGRERRERERGGGGDQREKEG